MKEDVRFFKSIRLLAALAVKKKRDASTARHTHERDQLFRFSDCRDFCLRVTCINVVAFQIVEGQEIRIKFVPPFSRKTLIRCV